MYLRCDGNFTFNNAGLPACTDWALLTESELAAELAAINDVNVLSQLYELLELAFSTPSTEAIQTAFMAGCSIPLIAFMVSWGYQTVINFLQKD